MAMTPEELAALRQEVNRIRATFNKPRPAYTLPAARPDSRTYGGYTIDQLYNALAKAETGSHSNPWIRTEVAPDGGSTAYGPVQLTLSTAADFVQRHPKAMRPYQAYWSNVFKPQGTLFRYYGREPKRDGYDRRFDYHQRPDPAAASRLRKRVFNTPDPQQRQPLVDQLRNMYSVGTGLTHTDTDRKAYEGMSKDIMRIMAGEIEAKYGKQFLPAFVKRWRGATPSEEYSNKVMNALKQYRKPQLVEAK